MIRDEIASDVSDSDNSELLDDPPPLSRKRKKIESESIDKDQDSNKELSSFSTSGNGDMECRGLSSASITATDRTTGRDITNVDDEIDEFFQESLSAEDGAVEECRRIFPASSTASTMIQAVINITEDEEDVNQNVEVEDSSHNTSMSRSVLKRKKTAPVWTTGCAIQINDGTGAKCNFCEFVCKIPDGSTTAMIRHLERHHPKEENVQRMTRLMQENVIMKKQKIEVSKMKASKTVANQPKLTNFVKLKGTIDRKKVQLLNEGLVQHIILSNDSWNLVEEASFRKLMFTAEPNYVMPSRRTITRLFDQMSDGVSNSLRAEIKKDITEAGHLTLNVITDHGTSNDVCRTKRNAVVVTRTTKDFIIKTDTVALIQCQGSQTGLQIRKDVKEALIKAIDFDSSMILNWVTDGASTEKSARRPGNHPSVGLNVNFDGTCADHTMDLLGNDSLYARTITKQLILPNLVHAVEKMKSLVTFFHQSSLARQFFENIMKENNMNPLKTVRGTSNRFFTKYFEVERFVDLREMIDIFLDTYSGDIPAACVVFADEEWYLLEVYRDSLKLIVKCSEILEGAKYCTSSSLIPMLDAIQSELSSMKGKMKNGEGKQFISFLLDNLVKESRFGTDLRKTKSPYNVLTLLDVRYGDIYFNKDEKEKAFDDLSKDVVYATIRESAVSEEPSPISSLLPSTPSTDNMNAVERRRQELLIANGRNNEESVTPRASFQDKLRHEVDKIVKYPARVGPGINPMEWFKDNQEEFPLLSKYWLAYSSFPATSCCVERVFNIDGLVYTNHR